MLYGLSIKRPNVTANVVLEPLSVKLRSVNYDQTCMDELCKSQTVDPKYFWYLVNRHKKQEAYPYAQATTDELSGKTLDEPEEILRISGIVGINISTHYTNLLIRRIMIVIIKC